MFNDCIRIIVVPYGRVKASQARALWCIMARRKEAHHMSVVKTAAAMNGVRDEPAGA